MTTNSVKSNLSNLEKKMEIVQKRMSARNARAASLGESCTSTVSSKERVVVDVKKSKLSQGLPESMRGILLGIPHEI